MVAYLITFPGEISLDPANIPRVPFDNPVALLLVPTSSPKSVAANQCVIRMGSGRSGSGRVVSQGHGVT